MSRIKFGVAPWHYAVEGSPGFDAVARRVAEFGYEGIELDGSMDWFHPSLFPTKDDRRALRERVFALGLEPNSYNPECAKLAGHECLVTGESDASRRYLEDVGAAIQMAADLETGIVRLDTALDPPGPADRVDRVVAIWSEAASMAEQAGVRIAWEFEPGFMCNRPSEVLAVVEGINSPAFGVLFDTSHAHMVANVGARQDVHETLPGGSAELARQLEGRIVHTHIIDSDGTLRDEFTSTHVPIGDGEVDFADVLGSILQAGYPGPWFNVDLCFQPTPGDLEERYLANLRSLLDAAGAPAVAG